MDLALSWATEKTRGISGSESNAIDGIISSYVLVLWRPAPLEMLVQCYPTILPVHHVPRLQSVELGQLSQADDLWKPVSSMRQIIPFEINSARLGQHLWHVIRLFFTDTARRTSITGQVKTANGCPHVHDRLSKTIPKISSPYESWEPDTAWFCLQCVAYSGPKGSGYVKFCPATICDHEQIDRWQKDDGRIDNGIR
jgi:hypothetical protein